MPRSPADYFCYLPVSPDLRRWGLGITGAGIAMTPANSPYPPASHPADHAFEWTHGRVLDALQIILISSGGGTLETRATGQVCIEAGMAFLLLPKTWHRYRPNPKTGWKESWIEITGPVVDKLLAAGTFSPAQIVLRGAIDAGLETIFDGIHRRVSDPAAGFQPELSAAALQVLAACVRLAAGQPRNSRIQSAVQAAEKYLAEHQEEPVNIETLAQSLGIAYSHFRRAFRAQTGFAPWQYVLHLRLTRARRLLASSDAKLEEVALRVGFSSGFHLSIAFKQAYGQSPAIWRRSLAKGQ